MPPPPPVTTKPPQPHPTFVNISVPINTPPSAIRSTIQAYNPPPFPLESIDPLIHFSVIPGNDQFKQAHIKILDNNATNTICNFFNSLDNRSYPHPSTAHPPTGTCPTDIDTSPPLNLSFPTNCRAIGCMLHNLGTESTNTNATEDEIQTLETHGHTYHSDLLDSLPDHTLSSISWHRCKPPCRHIAFTNLRLQNHQQSCTAFHTQQKLQQLRTICPATHRQQLEHLIANNLEIDHIRTQLLDWLESSTLASGNMSKKDD